MLGPAEPKLHWGHCITTISAMKAGPIKQANVQLTEAGTDPAVAQAALDANRQARVDGLRSALSVLALLALGGLFVARRVPDQPAQSSLDTAAPPATEGR